MSSYYWLLAITCTFGNCAFCEYIISDISVSRIKAEIKSERGGGINYKPCHQQQQLLVTLDVLKGHKIYIYQHNFLHHSTAVSDQNLPSLYPAAQ
jgi:hypothetical protein